MFYIEVERGVRVAVEDLNPAGKKAIFLIHGWPVNRRMFEYQLDVLPRHGFRCIAMDLRGFGQSDAPWGGYDYNRMADDVLCVLRAINVQSVTLAGFSMGGAIAIRYMARHAGFKVGKLALLAAAAPSFTQRPGYPYGMPVEQVNAMIAQVLQNRPQTVVDFGEAFFASNVTQALADWFTTLGWDASGQGTYKTLEALRDEDLRQDLARIHVPTGIFHGMKDQLCPFEFALEMNKGIPRSKLFPFEQSGHAIFYDQLELFNRSLLEFLNT